jgi:YgiT-type zinc finger domain-containing protein
MICLVCTQASVFDGLAVVRFERGEFRLIVSGVPARLCPNCRETYVQEDVAVRLLQMAEDVLAAGLLDASYEYEVA